LDKFKVIYFIHKYLSLRKKNICFP